MKLVSRLSQKSLFLGALVALFCTAGYSGTLETPLQSKEQVKEGNFYSSHPTHVQVVKTDYRYQSANPETLLRVTMETIVPNRSGVRRQNLFFAQQHVSEYIEAIDAFLRLCRSSSPVQQQELARLPSWESFQVKRDLKFSYIPVIASESGGNPGDTPLLEIRLAFDVVHEGGAFYFTPADAQELLNLLFDFIGEV